MGSAAEFLKQFANDEQDPVIVEEIHRRVSEILTSDEEIRYIAVQKKPLINVSPDAAVLTTRRFIIYRASVLGSVSFMDYPWRDLHDVKLREALLGADLSFQTVSGSVTIISYLPKTQARKLYAIAQEMEERVREERRNRDLEDKRAAAGGFVMHTSPASAAAAPSTPATDPLANLQKLKAMMDAGLITSAEYDAKKMEILSRL